MSAFTPHRTKAFVTILLLCSLFVLHIPSAKAQDIAAVCGEDPAINLTADNVLIPGGVGTGLIVTQSAAAGVVGVGMIAQATGSIINLPPFLFYATQAMPLIGQIAGIAFLGYMVINKLLHRSPLPGPGVLTTGPDGYAMVGVGYGSDDHGAFMNFWEGELQIDGSAKPVSPSGAYPYSLKGIPYNAHNTELAQTANETGGDDCGAPQIFVPENKYAVGWTFVPSRTSGGRPYRKKFEDGIPKLPCYFQMFRKIDPETGMLVGPLLSWSGAGDPADNLTEIDNLTQEEKWKSFNGSCGERGYRSGFDLKLVKLVSDLPDPSKGYITSNEAIKNRCKDVDDCRGDFSGYCSFQGEVPVVDLPDDLPPSKRVIIGMRFELTTDADVGKVCLAFNVTGKVRVHSYKEEDPNTDLGLEFSLEGPTPARGTLPAGAPAGAPRPPPNTPYENAFSALGTYTLSVPPGTESLFAGYTCKLKIVDSSLSPAAFDPSSPEYGNPTLVSNDKEVSCLESLSSILDTIKNPAMEGTEFYIEFARAPCQRKDCNTIVPGGAVCGDFENGCDPCDRTSSDPAQKVGCFSCGTCRGAGEVCTAAGQCESPFDVSCDMTPARINKGESTTFNVGSIGATSPLSCVWQSASPLINGRTTCSFTQTFAAPGNYDASVTITDSSSPPRTGTGTCTLQVLDPTGPIIPPPVVVTPPNYDLCKIYRVVVGYGVPIFAIMVVIAGFFIVLSFGDPTRVTKGKKALGAAVAGLVVVVLAKPMFVAMMTFLGFRVFLCGQAIP